VEERSPCFEERLLVDFNLCVEPDGLSGSGRGVPEWNSSPFGEDHGRIESSFAHGASNHCRRHKKLENRKKAMKRIAVLGSTGSIGRSSLDVIGSLPDEFRVSCLSAQKSVSLLHEQIERFHPSCVVVADRRAAAELRSRLASSSHHGTTMVLDGESALTEVVQRDDIDQVIVALVGFLGLQPTIAALRAGKTVALANKETLVVGGELITRLLRETGGTLLPIDSEHSAILQCFAGESRESIANLILTASGGPFLRTPTHLLSRVTSEQALQHPNWSMGRKITIDSATLMNKGLEVIEAHYLFGFPAERIRVVIHPQSIVHSMVEFVDGSIKAQLGLPDMKIPIQYALTYPARTHSRFRRLDFTTLPPMTFERPDLEKFRCLALAYEALRAGGTMPAVLNAANEVAVELFLDGAIRFTDIPAIIESALAAHDSVPADGLETLTAVDRETRQAVREEYTVHH